MKPTLFDLRFFLTFAFWGGCLSTPILAQQPANSGRQPDRGRVTAPDGTKVLRDLEYARAGDKALLLDLYLPENSQGPLPVIVGIHGGGWANGSKEGGQGAWLARHGYAVAPINYRLSGEAIFPAQIEDCKAAVRWLRANAGKYGLNPDRIGATGHSAGGHLASLLATTGDVPEFDKGENLEYSSRIQAACPLAGPSDLLQMDAHALPGAQLKHDSPGSPEARLIGGPIQENKEKAARANPIAYVTKDDPPLLIIHGDQDSTVPWHQAQVLYEGLKQAGVSVYFHTIEGAGHGLGGREVNEWIVAFFDTHLKAKSPPIGPAAAKSSKSTAVESLPSETTRRSPPSAPRRGPGIPWEVILSRSDADKDGRISKGEFRGPPPLFDRLDRNRDGVLTKEEHDAAFPPSRTRGTSAPRSQGANQEMSADAGEGNWTAGIVKSPDGKEISLLWTSPAGEGPFPVAVFVHGAPGGIGEEGLRGFSRSSRWREFVKRGFIVCLADYRGHPQGQPFTVLNGEVNAADDVAAIVKHLASLPKCDTNRLALIGGSLGGMAVLEAVTTGKLAPACIVLNAPATFPLLRLRGRPEPGRELAEADFDKQGALARVRKVSCPVLIVQGSADGLAPLNKKLHEVLKETGKDARIEMFEGQSHGFTNGPESDAYRQALQLTAGFVAQHTKSAEAAAAQRRPREKTAPGNAQTSPAAWAEPEAEPEGMKYRTFFSKAAGTDVSYLIYLPPDYETAQDKRYPVVYWLHGRGGSQTGASQLVRRLDPVIRDGKAPLMIVVGVNGLRTSSFVDSADGNSPVQTVIVKELIPHVDATYRTIVSREGRAIEGFSMGGAGAAKIGFKYPELFGTVSILAGALHDVESYKSRGTAFQDIYGGKDEYFQANSPWVLVEKNADAVRGRSTVRIVVGGKDNLQERNAAFHQLLDRLEIAHDFTVVQEAPHSPGPLYDGVGDQSWAFYRKAFEAIGKD